MKSAALFETSTSTEPAVCAGVSQTMLVGEANVDAGTIMSPNRQVRRGVFTKPDPVTVMGVPPEGAPCGGVIAVTVEGDRYSNVMLEEVEYSCALTVT